MHGNVMGVQLYVTVFLALAGGR